ncbi:hypothetical protein [Mycobacterium uberis]|nr:hypothetical protein [Mycobacterium uberis]
MTLTGPGGTIGCDIPAVVIAPDCPVLCLEYDGSGMYTIEGLRTQGR